MMHRKTRSDAGDISSPRSSRAPSFSSERAPSVAGSVTFQMPTTIRPAPAYIAASVASQTITDHHNANQVREDLNSDDEADPSSQSPNALFSEQALSLLNAFLDHLLFAFLASARSPSLTAIRPAITDVLKPRLAREAMATADEELQGLLAGDEEEFPDKESQGTYKWDVEKVWKRTRLRIMVYTRLGELEDEDEERYVQQERGLSMAVDEDDEAGLVSWASAIFLTSVIEYVAEQTLLISGSAAFARMAAKLKKLAQQSDEGEEPQLERVVVEEFDVEKIALNSALGRLWRTWRKRVRSPVTPLSPRGPRSSASFTSLHRRQFSRETMDSSIIAAENVQEVPEHKPTETEIAANIPLPIGDNDVNEIEVPGLARQFDNEDETASGTQTPVPRRLRPTSYIMLAPAEEFRGKLKKERPISMPPPEAAPFTIPAHVQAEEDDDAEAYGGAEVNESIEDEAQSAGLTDTEMDFVTPMERHYEDDESYIADERQEGMHHRESVYEPDADMVAFAASTGMGFGMSPISPAAPTFERQGQTADAAINNAYEAEPQVLQSKRMSIEKPGTPGLVRTYSMRSSRKSTPSPPREPGSYLDDPDDDLDGPDAIGVAHTSNVPIRATPSPNEPVAQESDVAHGKQKEADHQGFVELTPRHAVPIAAATRQTPSPERVSMPDKSVERKPVYPERNIPRREMTPPKARIPTLSSLDETETWTNASPEHAKPRKQYPDMQRASPSRGSPKSGPASNVRESPAAQLEKPVVRNSQEGSPRAHTGAPANVEKSSLQRVSSSSSKSASTSILHIGHDSESSFGRPRAVSGRRSEEDVQRDFDSLVKGDETVKFTLTPQSMRDMEETSAVRKVEARPSTSTVTVYPRVNADPENQFGSRPIPSRTASRNKSTSSQPTPVKKLGLKPMAREPRIQSESMRDFADFIRSTGPAAGEERPVQPFVSLTDGSTPPSGSAKSPNASSTAISGLGRKLSIRQTSSSQSNGSGEGPSARPRVHMEPRSPAGQRSGNDDLIDFIRQGPPGANNGQPRIPRSVAPFRTTVDSDQFDRMLDDGGNIESAYGSQVSTNSKHSAQTSNSRTGLLPAPSVVQPAYSNTPQKLTGNMSNPEPQIQRTRRRIKDPYAIDLSDDEDDDLLTALPASGQRKEESLMDFLNSMEPPKSADPQPLQLSGAALAAARARAAGGSNTSLSGSASGAPVRNGVGINPSVRTSGHSAQISASITSDAPRARGPKLQARVASARDPRSSGGRSSTNDLADFLRNSGPPEPPAPAPGATVRKEENKRSINAKFWRKKTYPDMP
ncbi:hypothetical protein BU24DRAFT_416616 [Aaosphaeria arxii CBS 175.79]|uniref:Uncharacterized protein n=1 Tax=Aaosphaeria arxii CBS 175.79 TaxID=1450172 RepID=A0A6A5Y8Q6_9PLEO|nr:uncharacterized protein BU24DRAFT_416616 [Aaosphaeria arxii CBS 175.79]KAF2020954.1 hypothetical protein BU24DRAFT_416616 [Aaosphaeria arxii CBS 175.79]